MVCSGLLGKELKTNQPVSSCLYINGRYGPTSEYCTSGLPIAEKVKTKPENENQDDPRDGIPSLGGKTKPFGGF